MLPLLTHAACTALDPGPSDGLAGEEVHTNRHSAMSTEDDRYLAVGATPVDRASGMYGFDGEPESPPTAPPRNSSVRMLSGAVPRGCWGLCRNYISPIAQCH